MWSGAGIRPFYFNEERGICGRQVRESGTSGPCTDHLFYFTWIKRGSKSKCTGVALQRGRLALVEIEVAFAFINLVRQYSN